MKKHRAKQSTKVDDGDDAKEKKPFKKKSIRMIRLQSYRTRNNECKA